MGSEDRLRIDISKFEEEADALTEELASASVSPSERARKQRKLARLRDVITAARHLDDIYRRIEETRELLSSGDSELSELARSEIDELEREVGIAKARLEELLLPSAEDDDRSVFLEVRAGAGGQEAALFAADLVRMYTAFAEKMGWKVSVVDADETDLGGFKEIVLNIRGPKVYRYLKFESGVHRVQRVPKTESAGRIHTSTVTVAVIPEVEDVEVDIKPEEIKIDTFRAGGAGGQHVNKTDSAVRITHLPTGLVVSCQDERSQSKNKAKAMKILRARLYEMEKRKREEKISETRKRQIGTGERSEKIRTYNFPQNRVTDHRIGLTIKALDRVLDGELEKVIDPLLAEDAKRRGEELRKQLS